MPTATETLTSPKDPKKKKTAAEFAKMLVKDAIKFWGGHGMAGAARGADKARKKKQKETLQKAGVK